MPPTWFKGLRNKLKSRKTPTVSGTSGTQRKSNLGESSNPSQDITINQVHPEVNVNDLSADEETVHREDLHSLTSPDPAIAKHWAPSEPGYDPVQRVPWAAEDRLEDDEPKDLSDTIEPSLITLWLQHCEQHHGAECTRRELEPNGRDVAEMNIILIDVKRKCLVTDTTAARYFALSYVWGSVPQLQNSTTLSESLMIPGALNSYMNSIPQVILDAMELVYSIGEKYLWVDSLCIVQDDADSKHDQISHMAIIYSSALMTIVAASARDASSNLPGLRPGTRWPREKQEIYELNRPLRPDLVLKAVDRTIYVSRAWTFQERHLSRRCLYFLDEQVYFQCRAELWCEEAPIALLSKFIPTAPPEIGLSIMPKAQAWGESIREEDWDRGFGFYAEIIQEYSWKLLTYPEDVTKALSGMLGALEQHSGWTFAHCLPEQLLDWALLWVPAGSHQRRPAPPSGPILRFPSWSWIGWVGPITFNLNFGHTLKPLNSLLSNVEIESVGETISSFRGVNRILSGKRKVFGTGIVGEEWEKIPITTSQPLTPGLCGSALRFTTSTISADKFQIKEMPPWEWNSAASSDTRARHNQTGVFVTMSGEITGYFPGVSIEFFGRFRWSRLRLVAMSAMLVEDVTDGFGYGFGIKANGESNLWQTYLHWANNPERFQKITIYNVMLVQRRGNFHERVAVGRIDIKSFDACCPVSETIQLV